MQEHKEVAFFVIFAGCARKNHACRERRIGFLSDLADFATVVFLCSCDTATLRPKSPLVPGHEEIERLSSRV